MRKRLLGLAVLLALGLAQAAIAAMATNPADRLLRYPIEPDTYDAALKCVKRPSKGALALQGWLEANVRGESWGIVRCERLSKRSMSLHSEGRAIDWRLNARRPSERAAARRLIALMLAPDSAGNPRALARRMGVQEMIFDCRYWGAGMERPGPYSLCFTRSGKRRRVDDTSAHRDHIHIGIDRAAARLRTSFWRYSARP